MSVYNFKDTTLYKKAFNLSMEIFEICKSFPKEEKYSLTDQVRRSSRSVCANLAEAYRKKGILHISFINLQIVMLKVLKLE